MTDIITKLARPEIAALKPYSSARKEGEQDMRIFLDANENPYAPYPATPDCEGLQRYPEPQPEILLSLFTQHYGVAKDKLLITRGADEAIDLLLRAFCTAGKDGILICPPTFAMYEMAANIQNAAIHRVPLLVEENFQLDMPGILAECAANANIKLVFVCTPNNPTGALIREKDIIALCEELAGTALVIADEAYVEFSGRASLAARVKDYDNLVVLRTLSKEYSLAGERCGVTIAHPQVISLMGRILAPYPIPVSAVRAIALGMSEAGRQKAQAHIRDILAEKARVIAALETNRAVYHIHHSDTNYLLVEVADAPLLMKMTAQAGIKIRDRSGVAGIEGCVRFSIGTPEQNDALLSVFADFALRCGEK